MATSQPLGRHRCASLRVTPLSRCWRRVCWSVNTPISRAAGISWTVFWCSYRWSMSPSWWCRKHRVLASSAFCVSFDYFVLSVHSGMFTSLDRFCLTLVKPRLHREHWLLLLGHGHFPRPACHPGILFLLCCEIRTSHCCTSDSCWRLICLALTRCTWLPDKTPTSMGHSQIRRNSWKTDVVFTTSSRRL